MQVNVQNRKTCLFWKDNWKSEPLSSTLPKLFSFPKNKSILVAKAIEQGQLTTLFHLPLSEVAYGQLQNLAAELISLNLSETGISGGFPQTRVYTLRQKFTGKSWKPLQCTELTNGCGLFVSQKTKFSFAFF